MTTLKISNVGPIKDATVEFGDLTVFVGPQATGKSLALQWLKLLLDTGLIQDDLLVYGGDWGNERSAFLDLYFGEGMRSTWTRGSQVSLDGKTLRVPGKKYKSKEESVFLIPAQRVLTLRNGWPRPFSDYSPGDPYVVRSYSDKLRRLMEWELGFGEDVFPKANRLKHEYRDVLDEAVFAGLKLRVEKHQSQKRLVLQQRTSADSLPFMVWSAGQREFVPLLLGLYWLMPTGKIAKRDEIEWVIIEELEMGLHAGAISAVLLLLLELLHRGYRVCLTTHSPQVLEAVWAIRRLSSSNSKPNDVLGVLGATSTHPLRSVAASALKKELKVFYFEQGHVRNITNLNPDAENKGEHSWGGLLDFSERANEAVARAAANS